MPLERRIDDLDSLIVPAGYDSAYGEPSAAAIPLEISAKADRMFNAL
jgi:hypothetical protein